jgi:hypothetical protein
VPLFQNELRAYHKKYGHCNVKAGEEGYKELAAWVKRQRLALKEYNDDLSSVADPIIYAQIMKLREIDFKFRIGRGRPRGR